MPSLDSRTASIDPSATKIAAEIVAIKSEESPEEVRDTRSIKRTAEVSGLDVCSSAKRVSGKNGEKWKPVKYRGTFTRPLAYFGNYEVKPETKQLPWISDHTSGKVHDDMHTISMLFNENLTLPKEAENFIAQSAVLKEEARWERLKAAFYGFYPEDVKKQAFEVLSKMSSRDASRIIAEKTSRFENELILIWRPKNSVGVTERESASVHLLEAEKYSEEDAAKLNYDLSKIASRFKDMQASAFKLIQPARCELQRYQSFAKPGNCYADAFEGSRYWSQDIKDLQAATGECSEAPLLYLLEHAVARYEPRTGWIHVKTQPFFMSSGENSIIFEGTYGIKLRSEYQDKKTPEEKKAAINKQMENFEHRLCDRARGHFLEFDFYHNDPAFREYKFRVPYDKISPIYCPMVLEEHLQVQDGYYIVSRPQTSDFTVSHHEMKVYLDMRINRHHSKSDWTYKSTLESVDSSEFCLNCFSKDHHRWKCEKPEFGFACVSNSEG